jgi:hypothetical protein
MYLCPKFQAAVNFVVQAHIWVWWMEQMWVSDHGKETRLLSTAFRELKIITNGKSGRGLFMKTNYPTRGVVRIDALEVNENAIDTSLRST